MGHHPLVYIIVSAVEIKLPENSIEQDCGMGSNFIKQYMQMEYNLHYFLAIQHLFAGRRAHTRHHEHTMVIILKAFEAIKKCNSFPFHLVHTASAHIDVTLKI